jgi:polysaccharide export outer membrane protein
LNSEIVELNGQKKLEETQRALNAELVADYDRLMKSGLARKPTYIEVKREEARIDSNIARLTADRLRAEVAIGDVEFRIGDLEATHRRRVSTELSEIDRVLLDLSITLPAAERARAIRRLQYGYIRAGASDLSVTVTRLNGNSSTKMAVPLEFPLQPGDIVQVGPVLPQPIDALDAAVAGQRVSQERTSAGGGT